jgi:hypothetical protein
MTLIAAIIGGVMIINNNSTPTFTEASLLEQYQQLLKDAEQQATQDCDDPKVFSKQTKELEERFDKLRQQKNNLIAEMNTDEWIPDLPHYQEKKLLPISDLLKQATRQSKKNIFRDQENFH